MDEDIVNVELQKVKCGTCVNLCEHLGKVTHTSGDLVAVSGLTGPSGTTCPLTGRYDMVFYTINPDPERDDYGIKLPDKQYKLIQFKISQALEQLDKHIKVRAYSIHSELTRDMNIHVHGVMIVPIEIIGYDKNLAIMSKIFNRQFGRQYIRSNVSSKFEWIRDKEKVLQYINKSNVYPPIHIDRQQSKDLTKWLLQSPKGKTRGGDLVPSPSH